MAAEPKNSSPQRNVPTTSYAPLTAEEEDHVILTRITNDERPLRRVIKKFHTYTSVAFQTRDGGDEQTDQEAAVEEAREAFLVELASFHLMLKKSAMICEGEARQVEEYASERLRIEAEHGTLKGQIEQLKTSLEHAQLQRKRKLDYDAIAEKVNILPSRDDLEQSIQALENDMAAIRSEHSTQDRLIRNQKSALDGIIANLGSLRFIGKETESGSAPAVTTPRITPMPEDSREGTENPGTATPRDTPMDIKEEKEEGETLSDDRSNRVFSEPVENSGGENGNDIEMGEVEENTPRGKARRIREDLEEGEASDESSELSDPPE
ncbi:hypothetical protein ONZ45_g117 [Pleurotus djamor]|nr:hypothetical protein ONZ45_g117 [Pleurotus djamor]